MPAKKAARKATRPGKAAKKAATPRKPARAAPPVHDLAAVRAWIADVKPEHRSIVRQVDKVLREEIPDVVATVKFRKPSQPLGVPFYGRPGHGWLAAMWSFKARVSVGFFGGVDLDPLPPRAQGARTRLVDYATLEDLDEAQLRAWARQAAEGHGWARV